ncbi:MAG TPA: RsmD family RNA methyltransferase [Rhodopila sp.]|uniref:RsmD family RNA methyltransferase n=1 Tax=Rhodopila sp. TaxID=2480087 RepID=UPI002C8A2280|nr:RsmD family RNA methyltransferase [Rhodopila sp.]HVY16305.1 RsmD family RNA methyltransferase [Rhodopila sp.]
MRIVAGAWRGRHLVAPSGNTTRPTADRVRQALFDTLLHASWGGRSLIEEAVVLDAFAGTGAFGLEALSRGARFAWFCEQDEAALAALRANIRACKAERRCEVVTGDLLRLGTSAGARGRKWGDMTPGPASLVFLDPPYGNGLVPAALRALADHIAPDALVIAELGRDEAWHPDASILDLRRHGAAQIVMFRLGG